MEFCRQLRILVESEQNVLCANLLIRLIGVMSMNIPNFKYIRTFFSSMFQKLKDRRASAAIAQSLLMFMGPLKL
jgi:hypothetical protein